MSKAGNTRVQNMTYPKEPQEVRIDLKKGTKEVRVKRPQNEGAVSKVSEKVKSKPVEGDNRDKTEISTFISYNSNDDKDILAIIELVRTGISQKYFKTITENTPFTLAEWARYLHLSERTIQRNQKERKRFELPQSERIVELAMLYKYGVEVFGSKDNFNTWLLSTNIALGGITPKDLLDTKFGISMVKDELGRIEHGVLA